MEILRWIGLVVVPWRSRHGLRDGAASTPDARNQERLQTGVRERMLTGTCGSPAAYSSP
jgi:hypothetical protein